MDTILDTDDDLTGLDESALASRLRSPSDDIRMSAAAALVARARTMSALVRVAYTLAPVGSYLSDYLHRAASPFMEMRRGLASKCLPVVLDVAARAAYEAHVRGSADAGTSWSSLRADEQAAWHRSVRAAADALCIELETRA